MIREQGGLSTLVASGLQPMFRVIHRQGAGATTAFAPRIPEAFATRLPIRQRYRFC